MRVIEGHHLGQRVASQVTKPSPEVSSCLPDVCQGLVADNTDAVDTGDGWECGERSRVEGDPGGPLERDHVEVSPGSVAVSTIGALRVLPNLTSEAVGASISIGYNRSHVHGFLKPQALMLLTRKCESTGDLTWYQYYYLILDIRAYSKLLF